jgi:peptidoglycan/LPS O-acetylase OafA/YrhL
MRETGESPDHPKPSMLFEKAQSPAPGEGTSQGERIAGEGAAGVVGADTTGPASVRIDDIELLRAVAIILVLIEHTRVSLYPWLGVLETRFSGLFGFWEGVDLFFAISGFVIFRSLMPSLAAAGNVTAYFNAAVAFWIRRAWRLLPSAWLWLAIILAASVFFNRSGVFESFRANFEGAVAAILDVANIRTMLVYGKFGSGATFPYWSLSIEEQFYFLLPFVILLSRRWLPLVVGAGVLLQLFIPRTGANAGVVGLYFNMMKSDAILLGVLIAIWSTHPTYRLFEPVFLKRRPVVGFMLFAGLVLLLAATGSDFLHIVPFQTGLVALISALLVFIASFNQNYLWPPGPLKQVMLWFGTRSYALYLVHIPAYFFTREIWFRLQPPGTVFTDTFALRFAYTAAILLVILAELNYRLVELPLRRRGARIAKDIARRALPNGQGQNG